MIRWMSMLLVTTCLVAATGWTGIPRHFTVQDLPAGQGSLVVDASAAFAPTLEGRLIRYRQIGRDFLIGYDGADQNASQAEGGIAFNLDFLCIPWSVVESSLPYPGQAEGSNSPQAAVRANECLLYFGPQADGQLPTDLRDLSFEDLQLRLDSYLEQAVREQAGSGIELFILREPAYPASNGLDFTPGQWHRLILQACKMIRTVDPRARIAIEIIPQYLPSRGYTPYTFLDGLIRAGATFDTIVMSFSPPVIARSNKAGLPDPEWIISQVKIFADLGRPLFVRLSGFDSLAAEPGFEDWLDQTYERIFNQPTVIGIYWNALSLHPERLIAVEWGKAGLVDAEPLIPLRLKHFIASHTSQGEEQTDSNGQAVIQAYAGDYLIQLDGIAETFTTHIFRGEQRYLALGGPPETATPALMPVDSAANEEGHSSSGIASPLQSLVAFLALCLAMSLWGIFAQRGTKKLDRHGDKR